MILPQVSIRLGLASRLYLTWRVHAVFEVMNVHNVIFSYSLHCNVVKEALPIIILASVREPVSNVAYMIV